MKKNIGTADRIVRLTIAAVFVALYFTGVIGGMAGLCLLMLFVMLVVTSFVSFCPMYLPFRLSTLHRKRKTVSPS